MNSTSLKCFTIMPFSSTTYSRGNETISISETEWTYIFSNWIKKSIESFEEKIVCERSPEITGNFVKGIVGDINDADIVIADLTGQKPNVLYELGIRHALKNGTIIISQDFNALPSDLKSYYCFEYKYTSKSFEYDELFEKFEQKIHANLKAIIKSNFDNDNPVSDFLIRDEKEVVKSKDVRAIEYLDQKSIFILSGNVHNRVMLQDVAYISSNINYSTINYENGTSITLAKTLRQFDYFLDKLHFFRTHVNYLVNTQKIEQINFPENYLILTNGIKLPISRRRKSILFKLMQGF